MEEQARDCVAGFKQEAWCCVLLCFVVSLEGKKGELGESTEKRV